MFRIITITILLLIFLSPSSFASFSSSYSNPYSSDSVVAPIQIKDKGIYNLVISLEILNEPYEKGVYESDEYKSYIRRLKVEWSGVALLIVLNSKEQSINDLANLKTRIKDEITKLANSLKGKYSLKNNVEVVFSLSKFYLVKASND